MNQSEAAKRIALLRDQINEYRYNYHVLDKSIMSEAAADSLKHELQQLEAEYPELITPDSPTQRVAGKPLEKFQPVAHQTPMLSLTDVFNREELEAWVNRITKLAGAIKEYYVEIKMDGFASSLIYEDGVLVRGLTRGDGTTGEDVTMNLRTLDSVPLRLRGDHPGRVEARGEVVMFKADFAKLNAEREKADLTLFANPRNTAAGTIRQLDPQLVAARPLNFMLYGLASPADDIKTHAEEHQLAGEMGFRVEPHSKIVKNVDEIMAFAEEWQEKRQDLPYGTDGLVVTVNHRDTVAKLGVVGKAPRGAVAYKFPAEQATTKLKNIMVSIGRTGAATPFAVLEPTLVAGSTIQMATLHNENEIHRKDIRVGDTVIIQKAGDVIPEVVASLPKLRDGSEKIFQMPTHCPICGTKLEKRPEEAVWRCPNKNCYALEWGRIVHFASKNALDIEGLGEKVVDALLESKLIADPADLFHLTVDDVEGMPRFAQKSAENLVNAIQAKKTVPLDRFIYALGIRHVGEQTARDLAEHFGTLEKFKQATLEELGEIAGIGEVVAQSVYEWLKSETDQKLLHKFETEDVKTLPFKKATGKLSGQTFVITGTLEVFSREVGEEKVEALGGKAGSVVTKDTDYLVVGADPGGSKLTKATQYGTKQISEKEFLELLGD